MPATQSCYTTNTSVFRMITTCIVLPVNTLECNWAEKEMQHSPSNTYLSTHLGGRVSKTLFLQVDNLTIFLQPQPKL